MSKNNGNGRLDIVSFGKIGRNNGNGIFTFGDAVINDFCYRAEGWRVDEHSRFVANLTGDGKANIIGWGDLGVYALFKIRVDQLAMGRRQLLYRVGSTLFAGLMPLAASKMTW